MVDTNWSVITGAPSSGKTTLINALAKRGYAVAEEVARAYISQLLAQQSLKEIRSQGLDLQRKILKMKELREQHLSPNSTIFFDRGIPDSIAYYRYYHFNPQEVIDAAKHFRYRRVFFLQGLPVQPDNIRYENDAMAERLGELIFSAYRALGYDIITLPVVSVQQRLEMVIEHIAWA